MNHPSGNGKRTSIEHCEIGRGSIIVSPTLVFFSSFLPFIFGYTYVYIYIYIHPSIHPSIHLSIYLSVYLSVYLSFYLVTNINDLIKVLATYCFTTTCLILPQPLAAPRSQDPLGPRVQRRRARPPGPPLLDPRRTGL